MTDVSLDTNELENHFRNLIAVGMAADEGVISSEAAVGLLKAEVTRVMEGAGVTRVLFDDHEVPHRLRFLEGVRNRLIEGAELPLRGSAPTSNEEEEKEESFGTYL